jgi:type IV secretion system protein VirB10
VIQPDEPIPGAAPEVSEGGIVSVNARGGSGGNALGKVFFAVGVAGLLVVVGLYGLNHYRARQAAKGASAQQNHANESKPAQAGPTRHFEDDAHAAVPTGSNASVAPPVPGTEPSKTLCSDGSAGAEALGPDSQPLKTAQGVSLRVCADGHLIVPNIDGAVQPIGLASNASPAPKRPSRYSGEALISAATNTPASAATPTGNEVLPTDPAAQLAYLTALVQQAKGAAGPLAAGGAPGGAPANAAGSVGSQLTPSDTPKVMASYLGDRNLILPKGRSIDCGLSMRLISDLPGLASCILSENVYSDNGKVLLLERGSEAVGEYSAAMAQGQKRIFVLWTRIKTPSGVVINLNSPGADELGTSGLPGVVNNHWWERLGAAALLTLVQDAIAYKTAEVSNSGTGTLAVYQNTSQTTNNMAETILASTINIKPTLYKNQGDRGTIYVARDLDFSSVYALRPR